LHLSADRSSAAQSDQGGWIVNATDPQCAAFSLHAKKAQ
jgi:predicted enzyme related to lactoylglutathione lyase